MRIQYNIADCIQSYGKALKASFMNLFYIVTGYRTQVNKDIRIVIDVARS